MAPAIGTIPPPISWAQRSDVLYVIIDVECKDVEHSVTEKSFTFKGTNLLDDTKKYEVTLNFLNSINPEKVSSNDIGRCIEFTIYKKEAGPFWKSLTNDTTKLHFLKANFTKWKNESDDEEDNFTSMNDMLGDGFMDNKYKDFIVDDDDDSDDNIPCLSQNDDDEDDKKDEEKKDNKK